MYTIIKLQENSEKNYFCSIVCSPRIIKINEIKSINIVVLFIL